LLDPPTVDVTARCVGALAQVDPERFAENVRKGMAFIRRRQEPDGSWYGRWGANYVYGTWSALAGLNGAGEDMSQPYIRRAVAWLKGRQRPDGGWGEGLESYEPWGRGFARESTPSQTAWALMALLADLTPDGRMGRAVGGVLARRDGQAVFGSTVVGYLLLYSVAVGDLARSVTPGPVGVSVVDRPLSRLVESTGPFQYEPIAFVQLGVVDYLFAPLNAAIGLGLAVLVGLNLAVAYGAWRRPAACGLPESGGTGGVAGLLAGVPALLSGTVCCGPAILLVVGVQATAGLLAVFQWLLPVAVVLLIGSLFVVSRRVQL
jgi:hypothetical protein